MHAPPVKRVAHHKILYVRNSTLVYMCHMQQWPSLQVKGVQMTKLSLFLATALATATLAAPAHAAVTVDATKTQGSSVSTSFSSSTPITCADGSAGQVDVFGSLRGADSFTKQTGTPGTFSDGVFVEIDEYVNSCTGAFASGFGNIPNGYIPPDRSLRVARMIGSGTMTVTVTHSGGATRNGAVTGTITLDGVELDATFSGTTLVASTQSTITVTKN